MERLTGREFRVLGIFSGLGGEKRDFGRFNIDSLHPLHCFPVDMVIFNVYTPF